MSNFLAETDETVWVYLQNHTNQTKHEDMGVKNWTKLGPTAAAANTTTTTTGIIDVTSINIIDVITIINIIINFTD